MASAAAKMTAEEIKDLVRSLDAMGQLDAVLIEAQMGRQQVAESMNDSSKRPHSSEESETDEFEYIPGEPGPSQNVYKKQQPIVPRVKESQEVLRSCPVELPENVNSVAEWGKTICDLPKYASRELSYVELIEKSKFNDEMKTYLDWIFNTGIKSAKADDLRAYLRAVNWKTKQDSKVTGVTYPGTTMVRRMK